MENPESDVQPEEVPAQGVQFQLATCVILALLAGALVYANVHMVHRPFRQIEANVYGWPLPVVFIDPNPEPGKPSWEFNHIALYYDLTIAVFGLVAVGAFLERYLFRKSDPLSEENSAPAAH